MQSPTKTLGHYDDYKCVYAGQFIHEASNNFNKSRLVWHTSALAITAIDYQFTSYLTLLMIITCADLELK